MFGFAGGKIPEPGAEDILDRMGHNWRSADELVQHTYGTILSVVSDEPHRDSCGFISRRSDGHPRALSSLYPKTVTLISKLKALKCDYYKAKFHRFNCFPHAYVANLSVGCGDGCIQIMRRLGGKL